MISLAVFLSLLAASSAYKVGPPTTEHPEVCLNMIPQHGAPPMTTNNPITFKLSQTCFAPSQTVKLEVTTSRDTIEGLLVQARTGNFINMSMSLGEFRSYTKYTAPFDCFSGKKNALGHKDDEPKVKTMNIYWQAPATGLTEDVHVGGTFLIHEKEFYVNTVQKITYNANCVQADTGEEAEKNANGASRFSTSSLILLAVSALLKFL